MLIIGMIFSVSSVCAADLNDTQVISVDDFIQHDINHDIDCNDNSIDNTTEIDFDNIPEWNMDLNNTGVLPPEISYDIKPIIDKNPITILNDTDNFYVININFFKSPHVEDFNLKIDVDGKPEYMTDVNALEGIIYVIVGTTMDDFNETTVTVSYIINGETKFNQVTFEKSDFKPRTLNIIKNQI